MAELQTVAVRLCVDCLTDSAPCATRGCVLFERDPALHCPIPHHVLSEDVDVNAPAAYEAYRRHRNRVEGAKLPPWPEVPEHKRDRFRAIAIGSFVTVELQAVNRIAVALTAAEVKALRGARMTAHVVALACNEGSPSRLEEEARVAVLDRLIEEAERG